MPYSWEYLGQSLWQASVARIQHHFREGLRHAAEFLIELKLHEQQDKIAQIVTGSSSTAKHSMYDEYINASKGKVRVKGKGNKEMVKAESLNGVQHVMSIGSQAVAHKDITVPSIIHEDSQVDVQSAAPLVILLLNVLIQLSRRPRMQSGMNLAGMVKTKNGTTINGSQRV